MRMRRKKWARPELAVCPFFISEPWEHRDSWHELYEKRQPLWIEMGCGKGGFLAEWALARQDVNFLGIDMISDMLGVARRNVSSAFDAANRPVSNLLLSAWDISRVGDILGERDWAERIFINFCNPWNKPGQYKKRLTHPRQLAQYRTLLREGGELWFKTDDEPLFAHSLQYFSEAGFAPVFHTENLHQSGFSPNVWTEHEKMYAAREIPIKFVIVQKRG